MFTNRKAIEPPLPGEPRKPRHGGQLLETIQPSDRLHPPVPRGLEVQPIPRFRLPERRVVSGPPLCRGEQGRDRSPRLRNEAQTARLSIVAPAVSHVEPLKQKRSLLGPPPQRRERLRYDSAPERVAIPRIQRPSGPPEVRHRSAQHGNDSEWHIRMMSRATGASASTEVVRTGEQASVFDPVEAMPIRDEGNGSFDPKQRSS